MWRAVYFCIHRKYVRMASCYFFVINFVKFMLRNNIGHPGNQGPKRDGLSADCPGTVGLMAGDCVSAS